MGLVLGCCAREGSKAGSIEVCTSQPEAACCLCPCTALAHESSESAHNAAAQTLRDKRALAEKQATELGLTLRRQAMRKQEVMAMTLKPAATRSGRPSSTTSRRGLARAPVQKCPCLPQIMGTLLIRAKLLRKVLCVGPAGRQPGPANSPTSKPRLQRETRLCRSLMVDRTTFSDDSVFSNTFGRGPRMCAAHIPTRCSDQAAIAARQAVDTEQWSLWATAHAATGGNPPPAAAPLHALSLQQEAQAARLPELAASMAADAAEHDLLEAGSVPHATADAASFWPADSGLSGPVAGAAGDEELTPGAGDRLLLEDFSGIPEGHEGMPPTPEELLEALLWEPGGAEQAESLAMRQVLLAAPSLGSACALDGASLDAAGGLLGPQAPESTEGAAPDTAIVSQGASASGLTPQQPQPSRCQSVDALSGPDASLERGASIFEGSPNPSRPPSAARQSAPVDMAAGRHAGQPQAASTRT